MKKPKPQPDEWETDPGLLRAMRKAGIDPTTKHVRPREPEEAPWYIHVLLFLLLMMLVFWGIPWLRDWLLSQWLHPH